MIGQKLHIIRWPFNVRGKVASTQPNFSRRTLSPFPCHTHNFDYVGVVHYACTLITKWRSRPLWSDNTLRESAYAENHKYRWKRYTKLFFRSRRHVIEGLKFVNSLTGLFGQQLLPVPQHVSSSDGNIRLETSWYMNTISHCKHSVL